MKELSPDITLHKSQAEFSSLLDGVSVFFMRSEVPCGVGTRVKFVEQYGGHNGVILTGESLCAVVSWVILGKDNPAYVAKEYNLYGFNRATLFNYW